MAKRIIKKKASKAQLGSGIDALFGGNKAGQQQAVQAIETNTEEVVRELAKKFAVIPVNQIERNPDQPRTDFDEEALNELSDSLKLHGVIQPLTVRFLEPKRYQIISGERRWRASQLAGLTEVPAYIRVANDQTLLEMAIIENIQREDLNPLEIATSYHRLKKECDLTDEQLAERLGKPRTTITIYQGLLNLHMAVQQAIRSEDISMGHAKCFSGIDLLLQEQFLDEIRQNGWSVRQTESKAKGYKKPKKVKKEKTAEPTNSFKTEHQKILQDFKAFFGTGAVKINIEDKATGKGELTISFKNHDQLTDLFKCIEQ